MSLDHFHDHLTLIRFPCHENTYDTHPGYGIQCPLINLSIPENPINLTGLLKKNLIETHRD